MSDRLARSALNEIRKVVAVRAADQELLQRFVASGEEAAFSTLLDRYGPMVMRVCRHRLTDIHAAEDAFQATFLALARKARCVRAEALGCWLHRVATRAASRARWPATMSVSDPCATTGTLPEPSAEISLREAQAVLDEELERLPEKYRIPLILCYLEEKTRDEAVAQLGWPEGTFKRRLEKGRELLRQRLTRRGLTLSAGLVATLLASEASAVVPAALKQITVQTTLLVVAGKPLSTFGAETVGRLADNVLATMTPSKLRLALALALVLATGGLGMGMLYVQARGEQLADVPKAANDHSERARSVPDRTPRLDLYGDPLPMGAVARLGTRRFRQQSHNQALAMTPDGKALAVGGSHGQIQLFEEATGRTIHILSAKDVASLAFAPDGKTLASTGADGLRFWDVATGAPRRQLDGRGALTSVAWSPDSTIVATGGTDRGIQLWDAVAGKEIRTLTGPQDKVTSVSFAPDGKTLASGGEDYSVQLWDVTSGRGIRKLAGHTGVVTSVRFAPGGKTLASGGRDLTVRLWDSSTGKQVRNFTGDLGVNPGNAATEVAFAPAGDILASWGDGAQVRFWDVITGKEIRTLTGRKTYSFFSVVFAPDGRTVASTQAYEQVTRRWEVATGQELRAWAGHQSTINSIEFAPDGKTLVSGSWDGTIGVWEAGTGKQIRTWQAAYNSVDSMMFSPDGHTLATAGDGTIRLWQVATGQELRNWGAAVAFAAFTPDGKMLASGTWKGTVHLWDAATGKEIRSWKAHAGQITRVACSPDGRTLASFVSGSEIRLWDLATGRMLRSWKGNQLVFSPDGKTYIADRGEQEGLQFWEAATGKEIRSMTRYLGPAVMAPDGRTVAARDDNMVRLWDVATGEEIRKWFGHHGDVASLAFAPDGKTLASGSHDNTILVWDVSSLGARTQADAVELSAQALQSCWTDLMGAAPQAYRAIDRLTAAPRQSVPFLSDRVTPVAVPDPRRLTQLIAQLESDQFAERQTATTELEKLGDLALPALKGVLAGKPSLELRRRAEQLLTEIENRVLSGEGLRTWRTIEVLEQIGTPEAKDVLERIGGGATGNRITEEAKASLQRLAKRLASRR